MHYLLGYKGGGDGIHPPPPTYIIKKNSPTEIGLKASSEIEDYIYNKPGLSYWLGVESS